MDVEVKLGLLKRSYGISEMDCHSIKSLSKHDSNHNRVLRIRFQGLNHDALCQIIYKGFVIFTKETFCPFCVFFDVKNSKSKDVLVLSQSDLWFKSLWSGRSVLSLFILSKTSSNENKSIEDADKSDQIAYILGTF